MIALGYIYSHAFGGAGGSPGNVRCNGVLVGFDARGSDSVNRLDVRCQRADGSFYHAAGGGGSGGSSTALYCPNGYVGVGILGKADILVDALSLICGRSTHLADTKNTMQVGGAAGGGISFSYTCPSSSVAVGINYQSGILVDSVQLICSGKLSLFP